MSRDEGPSTRRMDWTEQRVFLGRPWYVWQLNLAALLAVLFVAFVGFSFSGPFLPLLVRHLGVTEPRAVALWSGVLIGLGPLSAVVASPLWGRLAERIGGRILLLRTVCGFAVLNALSAMATDVWQLAVLRVLMGALGGFTAVALTLASLSAPLEQTTRAIALVQSAQILGQMVGPALGGLMAHHFGIRAAFWGASGLAILAGGNMLLMYQEAPAYTEQRRKQRAGGTRMSFRAILWTPGFLPILWVLFVGTFTTRSYQALIPLFVASTVSSPVIVAGGALAATLSANLASRLVVFFPHAQVGVAVSAGLPPVIRRAWRVSAEPGCGRISQQCISSNRKSAENSAARGSVVTVLLHAPVSYPCLALRDRCPGCTGRLAPTRKQIHQFVRHRGRGQRGNFGMVIDRGHLDHVGGHDPESRQPPEDLQQLARGQPADLRRARARRVCRV
jgi:MFS transporter, DHA1 family, multidrug resistance protein